MWPEDDNYCDWCGDTLEEGTCPNSECMGKEDDDGVRESDDDGPEYD